MKGFRKTVALILTAMMVVSMFPVSSAFAADFRDTGGHWAEGTIDTWAGNGVLNGADGSFRPDAPITRAELAAVLNRVVGYNVSGQNLFSDVAATDWFYQDVLKLNSAGVMLGSDGNANPQRFITREEAAVLVARAFEVAGNAAGNDFPDAARVSSWAGELVGGLKQIGYISGKETGNFEPAAHITRAEAVKIIDNIVSAFYSKAGEYSDKASGNAVVRASGVTLLNASVGGKLYIMEGVGDGEVTIDGTTVSQETYIRGGGANSIIIKGNSKLNGLFLRKKEPGAVRVLIEGTGASTGSVKVLEAAGGARIEGPVEAVSIETGTDVTFSGGTVAEIAITANNARAIVEATSQITKINSTGDNVTITGTGKVANVYVDDGDGVTVNLPDATVVVSADAGEVKTGDNKVIAPGTTGKSSVPTGTGEAAQAGGGGGGSGGGGGGGGGGSVITQFIESATVEGGITVGEEVQAKVDVELTAQAHLKGGSVIKNGVTYKWMISEALGDAANWTDIATTQKYTPEPGDIGKYIKAVATGASGVRGTAESVPLKVVTAELADIGTVALTGKPYVGATITAAVKDTSGNDISSGLTYKWQAATAAPQADSPENIWTDITGAADASYTLQPADKDKYIRAVVAGDNKTVSTDSKASAAIGPVLEAAKIATVVIPAEVRIGNPHPVKAVVTFNPQSEGLDEFVTYQWQSAAINGGTPIWDDIEDATESTLINIPEELLGAYIRVLVKGNGIEVAATPMASNAEVVKGKPEPYTIASVGFDQTTLKKGLNENGEEITSGPDGARENTSVTAIAYKEGANKIQDPGVTYTWSKSDNSNGPWTVLTEGAIYKVPYGDVGGYLKASAKGDGYYVSKTEVDSEAIPIVRGVHEEPTVVTTALVYSKLLSPRDLTIKVKLGAGPEKANGITSLKAGDLTVSGDHYGFSDDTLTLYKSFFIGSGPGTVSGDGATITFTIAFDNNKNISKTPAVEAEATMRTFTVTIENVTTDLPSEESEVTEIVKTGDGASSKYYVGVAENGNQAYEVDKPTYDLLDKLQKGNDNKLGGLEFTFGEAEPDSSVNKIETVNVAGDVKLATNYTVGGDAADIPALTVDAKGKLSIAGSSNLAVSDGSTINVAEGGTVEVGQGANLTFDAGAKVAGEGDIVVNGNVILPVDLHALLYPTENEEGAKVSFTISPTGNIKNGADAAPSIGGASNADVFIKPDSLMTASAITGGNSDGNETVVQFEVKGGVEIKGLASSSDKYILASDTATLTVNTADLNFTGSIDLKGANAKVEVKGKITMGAGAAEISGGGKVAVASGGTLVNNNGDDIWGAGDVAIEIAAGAKASLKHGDSKALDLVGSNGDGFAVTLTTGKILLKQDSVVLEQGSVATLNESITIGSDLEILGTMTVAADKGGSGEAAAKITVNSGNDVKIVNSANDTITLKNLGAATTFYYDNANKRWTYEGDTFVNPPANPQEETS